MATFFENTVYKDRPSILYQLYCTNSKVNCMGGCIYVMYTDCLEKRMDDQWPDDHGTIAPVCLQLTSSISCYSRHTYR